MANVLTGMMVKLWTCFDLTKPILVLRGILQGNSLSPTIYVLTTLQAMTQAKREARKQGVEPLTLFGINQPVPLHLKFVNNGTLLTKSPADAQVLLECVDCHLLPLSLMIALAKLAFFASGHLSQWHEPIRLQDIPLQVNNGPPMHVLGFRVDTASWQAHCNWLHNQHHLLLARLTQCGLSGPNKILAYNWFMAGKVATWCH